MTTSHALTKYFEDVGDTPPQGLAEFHAREAFRELRQIYGFEKARQLMAEFINDEAGDRYVKEA